MVAMHTEQQQELMIWHLASTRLQPPLHIDAAKTDWSGVPADPILRMRHREPALLFQQDK